jgi:hypothetical protein
MKTQISRESHRPEKRYSGVYQQQGRMLTDADWNELVEVVKGRLDQALVGVVDSGAPRDPDRSEFGARLDGTTSPFLIRGGLVFADGVVARLTGNTPTDALFVYADQADYPDPPPLPAKNYVLYADVWERPVVSLEDPDQLRDTALHGADTTTRTQTMAQVKHCRTTADPEDPEVNPQIGNAELKLSLRSRSAQADACDPCADEVAIEAGTGNYLFRVEVHDVRGTPSNPTLELKWSSENGAEQYELPSGENNPLPSHFKEGDWIFEFYNETTEKHLGVRLAGSAAKRGKLFEGFPATVPTGFTWVRRWDGYCTLARSGGSWSLVEGRDRGVELSTTTDAEADGHVDLNATFKVRLQALLLTLRLTSRRFVAGDYWLAPVREAHGEGDTLLNNAAPMGIVHHYLRLGKVDTNNQLVALTPDELRRLSFPPLTDIEAKDVEFKRPCETSIYKDVAEEDLQTVADALRLLCDVTADQIGFEPLCETSIYKDLGEEGVQTVADALRLLCDVRADQIGFDKPDCDSSVYEGVPEEDLQTVADALELLCALNAGQIAYTPHAACPDMPADPTVQQALDALCQRPSGGGGCRVRVGEGGEFESLEEALRALAEKEVRCACLCVAPGDYELGDLTIKPPFESLCIEGCGRSSRLRLHGALECSDLTSIGLSKLDLDLGDEGTVTTDNCSQVELSSLRLSGRRVEHNPLLLIWNADDVRLAGCLIEARSPEPLAAPQAVFEPVPGLPDLFAIPDRQKFEEEAGRLRRELAELPGDELREMVTTIIRRVQAGEVRLDHGWIVADDVTWSCSSYWRFLEILNNLRSYGRAFAETLSEIRAKSLGVLGLGAVVIQGELAPDAVIEVNEIVGRLMLPGHISGKDAAPVFEPGEIDDPARLKEAIKAGNFAFRSANRSLRLLDNRLTSLDVSAEVTGALEAGASRRQMLEGLFRTGQARGNVLLLPRFHLAVEAANLTSNHFEALAQSVGWVAADRALYTGNEAPSIEMHNPVPTFIDDLSRVSTEAANLIEIQ